MEDNIQKSINPKSNKNATSRKEFEENFMNYDGYIKNINPVKTIDDYVFLVRILFDNWETKEVWFRGLSKERYELIPSIYRAKIFKFDTNKQRNIEDDFIRRAKSYDQYNINVLTRWEWYQIMQHHGLPTRLLDWTSASNIALYFALRETENAENPTVWVLEPAWLNKVTTGNEVIYYTDTSIQTEVDEIANSYVPTKEDHIPELPIAVLPSHIVPRITSQHGCFTIHGKDQNSIEKITDSNDKKHIAKIVIDTYETDNIKADLAICGVIETSLFPDLDGLARHLKWSHNMLIK